MNYQLTDFDFELPQELIAQEPVSVRSQSRLLDVRSEEELHDRQFTQIVELLEPRDLLVFNNSKVIAARLFAHKPSGGRVEILIERIGPKPHQASALLRVSRKPTAGTQLRPEGPPFGGADRIPVDRAVGATRNVQKDRSGGKPLPVFFQDPKIVARLFVRIDHRPIDPGVLRQTCAAGAGSDDKSRLRVAGDGNLPSETQSACHLSRRHPRCRPLHLADAHRQYAHDEGHDDDHRQQLDESKPIPALLLARQTCESRAHFFTSCR